MTRSYRGPGRLTAALAALLLLWAGVAFLASGSRGPDATITSPPTTVATISEPAGRPAIEGVESLPGGDDGAEPPLPADPAGQGPTTDEAPTTTLGYTPGTADDPTLPCPGRPHPEHHYACGTYVAPTTVPLNSVVNAGPVGAVGGSGACGGWLPPCWVMMRESGGNPQAVNWGGCGGRNCYGKWQFDPRTSQGLGYPGVMTDYSETVQDEAAGTLWANGRGCAAWSAC